MREVAALVTIMLWPVVPLFWIPVHCAPKLFRRLGILTYLVPAFTWLPVAYLIYQSRSYLLAHVIGFPLVVTVFGGIVFLCGALLQLWTGRLLSLGGLAGLPEISDLRESRLRTDGPYAIVRHPTYVSHSLMFLGVFLMTGVISLGVITVLDLLVINLIVIPLEDRELIERFGDAYRRYRKKVPAFFPRLRSN